MKKTTAMMRPSTSHTSGFPMRTKDSDAAGAGVVWARSDMSAADVGLGVDGGWDWVSGVIIGTGCGTGGAPVSYEFSFAAAARPAASAAVAPVFAIPVWSSKNLVGSGLPATSLYPRPVPVDAPATSEPAFPKRDGMIPASSFLRGFCCGI